MENSLFEKVIHLADNTLILGQRTSEWCGKAPIIEEDLALSNIALDLIGQTRMLMQYAGTLDAQGRDEDQLAFLRTEGQYRNFTLCELPNRDFAHTIIRLFIFSSWQSLVWQQLANSTDEQLKAIALKSAKETRYHLNHCGEWVIRLGDGTATSHDKAQQALDYIWPYTQALFDNTEHAALYPQWLAIVQDVFATATLTLPKAVPFKSFGHLGRHSEHMGHLLAEMQYMQRTYPGQVW